MEQVSDSGVGEQIQPRRGTSGLRSQWVMPFSWAYLQACVVRGRSKVPYVLGRTERAEHIWHVICFPRLRQPVMNKNKIQDITTVYVFLHYVWNSCHVRALLATHPRLIEIRTTHRDRYLPQDMPGTGRRQIFGWLGLSRMLTSLARLAKWVLSL